MLTHQHNCPHIHAYYLHSTHCGFRYLLACLWREKHKVSLWVKSMPGPWFNIKMSTYPYIRNPFVGHHIQVRWHHYIDSGPWCFMYIFVMLITIRVTSLWAWEHLKSQVSQLLAPPFVEAQIKKDIKAPPHWPLWGESTGNWCIGVFPLQRASNAENVYIWWHHYAISFTGSCSIGD